MALPQQVDLETLDYGRNGEPFANLSAGSALPLYTLDFGRLGEPYVAPDPVVTASAGFTLGDFTLAASASSVLNFSASAGFTLGTFTLSASASYAGPSSASGGFTLGTFTLAAATAEVFSASAGLTLGTFTLAAAAVSYAATGGLVLGDFTLAASAAGTGPISGSAGLVLGTFTLAAAAGVGARTSGTFTLGAFLLAASATLTFPHVGPLAITSVSPDFGGSIAAVIILGSGFNGTTRVTFGAYDSYTLPVVISDTEIHVIAPPSPYYLSGANHDPLVVDVSVYTVDGGLTPAVAVGGYTFLAPPVLTSISPNVGDVQFNTPVVVRGKNLLHAFLVELDGYGASFAVAVNGDGTQLTCTLITTGFSGIVTPPSEVFEVKVWNPAGPSSA